MKPMKREVVALCVAGVAGTAMAGTFEFNFVLTGSQEVPPTPSGAVGAAQLLYDDATMTFDLDLLGSGCFPFSSHRPITYAFRRSNRLSRCSRGLPPCCTTAEIRISGSTGRHVEFERLAALT